MQQFTDELTKILNRQYPRHHFDSSVALFVERALEKTGREIVTVSGSYTLRKPTAPLAKDVGRFMYLGYKPCGCVVGVVTDEPDRQSTADAVATLIMAGLSVNRVDWTTYRAIAAGENFMNCGPCVENVDGE